MSTDVPVRIWLNPSRFWVATQGMAPNQKQQLLDHLDRLAEQKDLRALSQFGFVTLYKPKAAA